MLPPKKSTTKKPSPVKKYKKTSTGDSLGEDLFEIIDPTGISSYDDVYRSYKENGLLSWQTGLEVLGALPIIGKAGKGIKLATTSSKYLKALSKTNKITAKAEKVIPEVLTFAKNFGETAQKVSRGGRANPIAAGSIAVGIGAKGLQKVTKVIEKGGKKVVKEVIKKTPANKRVINETVATVNSANTLSDVAGAVQGQVVQPITETVKDYTKEKEKEQYQPIPKKIVYYNTDPKRGEVETVGKEENVQYVPVSNSAQLEKWKNQKLAYGTNSQGIMKKKMNPVKRYANGTDAKGMDPNHYIISPAEALNDYNIMLAKAEAKANSNPWLPIVAIAGQAMQTGINIAGKAAMAKANNGGDEKDKAAMGMNNVQQDVEVEDGERYKTPQGQTGEFEGATHEENGIPLQVTQDQNANPKNGKAPEGTIIYSDRLKVGDKTIAERQATRERQIANLEKIASNNLADEAVKNAAKRKMMAIQKEEAADLQFQDQVNNLQAMADTMVQTFACGTGMKGVQKYGTGTPPGGIKLKKAPTADMEANVIKNLHDILGITPDTPGYGTAWGDKSNTAWFNYDVAKGYKQALELKAKGTTKWDNDKASVLSGDYSKSFKEMGLTPEGYKYLDPEAPDTTGLVDDTKVWDKSAFGNAPVEPNPMDAITEEQPEETSNLDVAKALAGDASATKKEPSKLAKVLEGNMPAVGDIAKLMGDYLGMTAGIKTAAEQRSTDVTHRNVFANAGEESQRLLDNAKQGIETSKAQAIVKATAVGRGGKKGARGSARGVNTMRGMDWLYDTALQQQIAEISANAAQQIAGIDTQKSSVAMSADQLKGQGEYQAAMANEAAKDAYYTALGLGRKDFATGLQQSGKDLNDMKTNKILEKLLSQSGEYAGMTAQGDIFGKPATASKGTNSKKIQTINGIKYQEDANGNLIKVTV